MKRQKFLLPAIFFCAVLLTACGKSTEEEEEEIIVPDLPSSENYAWIGDYIDESFGQALLTIEKSSRFGRDYAITVYIPSGDAAFSLWEANAVYDADLNALSFNDCIRTDVDTSTMPETEIDEADAELTEASRRIYTDGTGSIFVLEDESLIWIDDQDSRGDELQFVRIE